MHTLKVRMLVVISQLSWLPSVYFSSSKLI
jgi:hypothetical protein